MIEETERLTSVLVEIEARAAARQMIQLFLERGQTLEDLKRALDEELSKKPA